MNTIHIEKKIVGWKIESASTTTNTFKENHAVKRPKELTCHISHVKVKGESWTILVGVLDDKPYEVFGGLSKYIEIPKKYKDGILIKNGKINGISTYNLVVGTDEDDKLIIKDVVNAFENTTQGAFTRIISLSLRHGAPVKFVVDQLQKDQHSDVTSFSKVIARVLKKYIVEETKSGITCPKCNSTNVIFEGGCQRCLDCNMDKYN
jgi:ribonucleoside-diphosphate reductase alpha chain